MRFRSKTMYVESVTFEELVEHAKANGAKLMNGVPWSFDYKDAAVTHERDDCYVVTRQTQASFNFFRGDRLVTRADGIMETMSLETFLRNYEPDITCFFCDERIQKLPTTCQGCGAKLEKLVKDMTQTEYFDALQRNRKQALPKLMKQAQSTMALAV